MSSNLLRASTQLRLKTEPSNVENDVAVVGPLGV
jgi:hypothetical protein